MAYKIGDIVRFDVSFDYQGPSYTFGKLRCAVGTKVLLSSFSAKDWKEEGIVLPETISWARFSKRVLVTLKNVEMGETYDTEVVLKPNLPFVSDIVWSGSQNIEMGGAVADSEFRNLEVQVS